MNNADHHALQRTVRTGRFGSGGVVCSAYAMAVFFCVAGCSSLPTPMQDNAKGNRLSAACSQAAQRVRQAAQRVRQGDGAAFHECFFAAYSRMRDPMLGGEDLESIAHTLQQLLLTAGDHAFATALAKELPPIRSGVSWFLLRRENLAGAPETKAVIAATRDYDFELGRSIRQD